MKQKNLEQKTQVTEEQNAAKVENEPGTQEPSTSAPPPVEKERRFRQTDLPAHFIERRKYPRISTEQPPPPAPPRFDDYAPIIGQPELDEIRFLARHLRGKTVKMVNSTAVGGGVAEILNRLIPLAEELEIDIHWDVMKGGVDFFEVTKTFHNALHGGTYATRAEDFVIFREYNRRNFEMVRHDAEFTIIHDPQPAGLIEARREKAGHWIWRCHIDLSRPNSAVWGFLAPYISQYDGAIFSSPEFSRQLAVPQYLFHPSIDPLSE